MNSGVGELEGCSVFALVQVYTAKEAVLAEVTIAVALAAWVLLEVKVHAEVHAAILLLVKASAYMPVDLLLLGPTIARHIP